MGAGESSDRVGGGCGCRNVPSTSVWHVAPGGVLWFWDDGIGGYEGGEVIWVELGTPVHDVCLSLTLLPGSAADEQMSRAQPCVPASLPPCVPASLRPCVLR